MKRKILICAALLVASGVAGSSRPADAQPVPSNSHLRVWSATAHGDHDDKVINNSIQVKITATRNQSGPCPDEVDWGTLILTPGGTPPFSWTCNSCPNGFFSAVTACAQSGGCVAGDVLEWLVGVTVQKGGGNLTPGCENWPDYPDEVNYFIDSDNLGNGKRYHTIGGANCATTVTPVDDTYSATDPRAGFDFAIPCSDNGVTISLGYQ